MPVAVDAGNRFEQSARVRVERISKQLRRRRLLHHARRVKNRHVVGILGDDSEIVRHQDHGQPQPHLQLADQIENLRLYRHVERGGRLVRDQQARIARQRHRDHHALAHPARQLMRIVVDAALGVGNPDHPERLDRAIAGFGATGLLMKPDRLANLAADGEDRIQRGHRLLEDHRDPRAANMPHLGLAEFQQIPILENYFAATIRADSGSSRMIESTLAVLPDPDSPTSPSSLPGATEKLTPSTARTSPASVKNEVRSDLTSSSGFT